MSNNLVFELRDVTFRYQPDRQGDRNGGSGPVLHNVNWEWPPQSPNLDLATSASKVMVPHTQSGPLAIVGPSGSGKSTLLGLLGLLIDGRPFRRRKLMTGEIRVLGQSLLELADDRRERWRLEHFGFSLQSAFLLGHFSVEDNITLPLELLGKSVSERSHTLKTRIGELGLDGDFEEKLKGPAWKLSGGEKQRAALLRAVIHDPQVVFADEPTNNLDPKNARLVMDMLFAWARGGGPQKPRTLVFVTHDVEAAADANEIVTVKDGVVIHQGKVAEDRADRLGWLRDFFAKQPTSPRRDRGHGSMGPR